jgi:ABC-2 type transport system permease protein
VKELLKIEWLKIKNYAAFIVLGLFFLLGILGANYAVFYTKKNLIDKADPTGLIAGSSPYDFNHTWQTTSYVSGYLLLLPGLLLILLITNEFAFRTHRQNIIDGWRRQQFIDVKIAMAVIAAGIATLLTGITALIFGFASGSSFAVTHIEALAFFFLKALSYNMIAVLIAVLVRKTGFAIGLFFIYMGFENILSAILQGLSIKFKSENNFDIGNWGDYLPMNASDGLLHFPENTITNMAKNSRVMPTDYMYVTLVLAIAYLLLFWWWSRNRFIKTDL